MTPETAFTLPPQLQVADRTIEDAEARPTVTLSVAEILAQSSNVGAVDDRPAGRQRAVQPLDPPLRLRPPDRRPVPWRGAGDRAGAERILGLDDGQPADGPGALGDADADGRRLRGDRQRRHPAAAAADREDRRRTGCRAAGPPGDRRRPSPRRCARCSRACSRRAAPPRRSASPATRWRARPAPRRWPKTATYSETKYVASFIGFAPAQDPQLLVAVIVDQPQGEIYGGSVAAPAFGKIAAFALPYLGVPPE